jgi:hypothetical protein
MPLMLYKWEGPVFASLFSISFHLKVSSFPFQLGVSSDLNVFRVLGVPFHFIF